MADRLTIRISNVTVPDFGLSPQQLFIRSWCCLLNVQLPWFWNILQATSATINNIFFIQQEFIHKHNCMSYWFILKRQKIHKLCNERKKITPNWTHGLRSRISRAGLRVLLLPGVLSLVRCASLSDNSSLAAVKAVNGSLLTGETPEMLNELSLACWATGTTVSVML